MCHSNLRGRIYSSTQSGITLIGEILARLILAYISESEKS